MNTGFAVTPPTSTMRSEPTRVIRYCIAATHATYGVIVTMPTLQTPMAYATPSDAQAALDALDANTRSLYNNPHVCMVTCTSDGFVVGEPFEITA